MLCYCLKICNLFHLTIWLFYINDHWLKREYYEEGVSLYWLVSKYKIFFASSEILAWVSILYLPTLSILLFQPKPSEVFFFWVLVLIIIINRDGWNLTVPLYVLFRVPLLGFKQISNESKYSTYWYSALTSKLEFYKTQNSQFFQL